VGGWDYSLGDKIEDVLGAVWFVVGREGVHEA
jgi:hypothetical protein